MECPFGFVAKEVHGGRPRGLQVLSFALVILHYILEDIYIFNFLFSFLEEGLRETLLIVRGRPYL